MAERSLLLDGPGSTHYDGVIAAGAPARMVNDGDGSDDQVGCDDADLVETDVEPLVAMMDGDDGLAANLATARTACEALADSDTIRPLMMKLLGVITSSMQIERSQRGARPRLPDRWKYLNKLAESNPNRPLRAAVFEAMDQLLALVWPSMTSTERSQKARGADADVASSMASSMATLFNVIDQTGASAMEATNGVREHDYEEERAKRQRIPNDLATARRAAQRALLAARRRPFPTLSFDSLSKLVELTRKLCASTTISHTRCVREDLDHCWSELLQRSIPTTGIGFVCAYDDDFGQEATITRAGVDVVRLGNCPREPPFTRSGILGRMNGTSFGTLTFPFSGDDTCLQGRGGLELFDHGVYYHFKRGSLKPSMILARADKGDYAAEIIVKPVEGEALRAEESFMRCHREKMKRSDDRDRYEEWEWGGDNDVHRDQLGVVEPKWCIID